MNRTPIQVRPARVGGSSDRADADRLARAVALRFGHVTFVEVDESVQDARFGVFAHLPLLPEDLEPRVRAYALGWSDCLAADRGTEGGGETK